MISVSEYNPDEDSLYESSLDNVNFHNTKLITCIEPTAAEFEILSQRLEIPLDVLEQSADDKERPNMNELGAFTIVVFKAPVKRKEKMRTYSFTSYLSENLLLIISKHDITGLSNFLNLPVEARRRFFRKGTTYLLYEIIEKVMDDYFKCHEELENHINFLEDQMLDVNKTKSLKGVFKLKTNLIYFNKALSANRDVIMALEKGISNNVNIAQVGHFRLVYNDIIQLIDIISTDREVVAGAVEIYLSSVSNNLNVSIKKMTAWASLVLIPTFIASLYGMNFKFMPEIPWKYGYMFSLGLMAASVIALYVFFKKKEYL